MKYRLLAALAAMCWSSAQADVRGLQIEDLVRMERVGAPLLSPDGKKVLYTVRVTDMEKNRGITNLWMQDLNKPGKEQQLTTTEASDAEWSPNGDAVYFLSSRSGSSQIWRLPLQGGEAQQVTDLPLDVDNFRLSPKGDRILFSLAVFHDCKVLQCTTDKLAAQKQQKTTGRIYERLFVRHWDVWADGRRATLFSAAIGSDGKVRGEPVPLSLTLDGDVPSRPDGDHEEYQFSPDGKTVVFAARIAGKTEAWSTNFDLYQVPADGSALPKNLTADNQAWDTKARFSPDGKTLAYLAMKRPTFEADRFQVMLMDVATGKKRALAADWDRSAMDFRWSSDGRQILAVADDIGQHRLFALDVASGKVRTLTGAGSVNGFDTHGDTLVISHASLSGDSQLFSTRLSSAAQTEAAKMTRLTERNAAMMKDIRLGEYEQFSFAGANGDTVYGYVMKPWNAQPGQRYPVAFLVHGGPQGSFGNEWGYRWNPQIYAGAGYAAVFIDFHGSTGYGQKFTDSISGDWGGKPLEDLKKGLAAAAQKYPWLDTSRACALGASYGGYMMNWIAGNWNDGFRCIVNHDGVFDTRGMAYATDEIWFTEWENGGAYYDVPELHEKFNPVRFVKNWKTPMLVVQGELDFRIPTEQALGTFTALQRRGIESKLLIYPDENHWVTKPANSVLWHHTVLDWLKDHLNRPAK